LVLSILLIPTKKYENSYMFTAIMYK
jgi:hypothetical protein